MSGEKGMTKKDEIRYLDDEGNIFDNSRSRTGVSKKVRESLGNLMNKSVKVALIPCEGVLDGRSIQSVVSAVSRMMGMKVKTSYYQDKVGNYIAIALRENGNE
jgi:hypothetical protein